VRLRRSSGGRSYGLARGSNRSGRTRRGCGLGLVSQGLQHISGLGNVGQVDLGLELVDRRTAARAARSTGLSVLLVVLLDALGFIDLDGTRMRFLLRDSDLGQNVEDDFALYLELPCQVINSNLQLVLLVHSALFPLVLCRPVKPS